MIRRIITQNLRLLFLFVSVMPMLVMAQGDIIIDSYESNSSGKIDVTLGYNGDRDSICYYIIYEDNQGNVDYMRYTGAFSMDKRPATLFVDAHWHDDDDNDIIITSDVATYYGLASSALTTPFQYDGTVNAPNIIPALPTDATVTYASSTAEAAPTNSIDRNTGVVTIIGVTSPQKDTYAAYFTMPATVGAASSSNILNILSNSGYELGQFTLTVTQKPLAENMIFLLPESITYDGGAHTPYVEVKDGTFSFDKDYDYTVTHASSIKDVGVYPVTVTATANGRLSGGPITKNFSITRSSLNNAQVNLTPTTLEYNGKEQSPSISVILPDEKGDVLIDASNYDVTLTNATNVGTATVTITGKGNYNGSASAQFTITAKNLEGVTFSTIDDQTYTGNAIKPEPTVKLIPASGGSGTTLVKGTDFDFSYKNNINVPTTQNSLPTVTVTGKGNYTGTASTTFTIVKATPVVTAPTGKTLNYNGSAQALVNAGSTTLGTLQYSLDGNNYSTTIPTGKDAGTYTVYYRVVGDGNINDVAAQTVTATISMVQSAVATAPTAKTGLVYTGSAQGLINAGTATNGVMQYSQDGQSFSTTIPTGINAGSYDVWYMVKGNTGYTDVAAVKLTASIAKAAGSISYATSSISKTYGDAAFTNTLTKIGDGTVGYSTSNAGVATVNATTGKVTLKGCGTATITATVKDGTNYTYATKTAKYTLSVGTASMDVTATGYSGTYDGNAHGITVTAPSGATVKYGTAEGTYSMASSPAYTDAGTYTVYYQVTKDNYTTVTGSQTVVIKKAAGSISYAKASVSKTYGDAAFTNALTKTGDGTVSYSSSNTAVATVNSSSGKVTLKGDGTTTITATVKDGTNYTYATKTAKYTLSVGTASMDVTATGYSGTYDGNAHGITISAPSGATVKYGESEGTYNLTASPTYTDAGTYTVYYEVSMDNYTPVTGTQIVTINKANAKVQYVVKEFSAKVGESFDTPQVILDPANLVVTYSSSDTGVATVDAQTGDVLLVAPGQVTITATFAGNENYNSASDYYILTVLQRDIDPIDEDVVYTMDEDDFFFINEDNNKEEIKLDNTVIYDILFTLDIIGDPSETDGYDETEHCIVLNHPLSTDVVNRIIFNRIEPGTNEYAGEYKGLTFKVPAGKGYVIIDSQTDGDYQMMVKIGELEPVAFNHIGREKDSVLYECSEPTWVYVYNGGTVDKARMQSSHRSRKTRGHVKIYSITRSSSGGTGVERINSEASEEYERWYDLQGNRINRPVRKGIYILRGKKVIVR